MRRRSLYVVLACTGLMLAGCNDQSPTAPPALGEVQLQPAQVDALLAQNPSILELRLQSDDLLREPARTLARFALAKVQFDINNQRPTLYASSLIFAAIPLVERKLNRIPEEKVGRLIDLLCTLQQLIGPKLPPTSRLNMIPWCQLEPEELGNEAEFQLVSNATGGTVETSTEQLSLDIAANTMRDAAGNPVSNAFFTVLPLERRPPGSTEDHPCPQPFIGDRSGNDCYPEFYELTSRPLVQFVGTPALLQVCQLDPHSESPDAPSHDVLARLRLFARSAAGAFTLLPKFVEGEENPPPVNTLACDGDEDLGHTAIGPIDFSKDGVRNAFLAIGRAGSRALEFLGPKTLYASNTPTHGRVDREIIDFAGTVVGAIDPVVEAAHVSVDPNEASIQVGGSTELSAIARDDAGNILEGAPIAWSSNNNDVATVSQTGLVTGVAVGQAIITATSGTGSSFATITVTPAGCGVACPGGVLFGVNSGDDGLSVINPSTGVSTLVGRLHPDVEVFTTPVAMDVDPTSDVIYAWNNSSPAGVLLSLDRCTGRATQINAEPQGVLDNGIQALAIASDGATYIMRGSLFSVNKATGAATLVGSLGGPEVFGADFEPSTGTLYALSSGISSTPTLYTVNVTTGAATGVATLSQNLGVTGAIVFTPSGGLIGSAFGGQAGNVLFDIDKATGAVSNVRSVTGTGGVPQGMGFGAACVQIP